MRQKKPIFYLVLIYAALFAAFYWLDTCFHTHETTRGHLEYAVTDWLVVILSNVLAGQITGKIFKEKR